MFNFSALDIPVTLAAMAGGFNTPELVVADANAGSVRSFGFAYMSGADVDTALGTAATLTSGPINANFFVFPEVLTPQPEQVGAAALDTLPAHIRTIANPIVQPYAPVLAHQL